MAAASYELRMERAYARKQRVKWLFICTMWFTFLMRLPLGKWIGAYIFLDCT